jgi:hypothetical protein
MVSVLRPRFVVPAPVMVVIVLLAKIVKIPAFATPELAAIVPVASKASVLPAPIVVAPR